MYSFRRFVDLHEMAARQQLGRMVRLANDPDRLLVLMSASRDGQELFPGATKALEMDIRKKGFTVLRQGRETFQSLDTSTPLGVTPTLGGYQEPGKKTVQEKSVLVSAPRNLHLPPAEQLIQFFVDLAEKYDQAGVIIRVPGDPVAHEYTTKHHESPYQRIPYHDPHPERKPTYFTRPADRGTRRNSTAPKDDGMTFKPDFGGMEPTDYGTNKL
jgi:hypothetical protein